MIEPSDSINPSNKPTTLERRTRVTPRTAQHHAERQDSAVDYLEKVGGPAAEFGR